MYSKLFKKFSNLLQDDVPYSKVQVEQLFKLAVGEVMLEDSFPGKLSRTTNIQNTSRQEFGVLEDIPAGAKAEAEAEAEVKTDMKLPKEDTIVKATTTEDNIPIGYAEEHPVNEPKSLEDYATVKPTKGPANVNPDQIRGPSADKLGEWENLLTDLEEETSQYRGPIPWYSKR